MALAISLVSSESFAQKKGKAKKGKKADAAQVDEKPADTPEDPSQLEARTRYANGTAAFQKGDFAVALVEFQAAYDAKPHPTVLKSIAESQVSTGDILGGIATLERFLEAPEATGKTEVQARLDEIKAMLATLEVTSEPPGAAISLDGRPTGLTTPASIQVGPGPHTLVFDLAGYQSLTRDVTAAKGDMSLVAVSLTSTTPPQESQSETLPQEESPAPATEMLGDKSGPPPAFWAAAAVTGLGLIGGAVFGTMALNDDDKWKSNGGTQEDVRDSGKRNAIIADVSFGIAAAAAITGAIILIASGKKSEKAAAKQGASLRIAPVSGKSTIGMGAVVEF
jgi:hypothetical protein